MSKVPTATFKVFEDYMDSDDYEENPIVNALLSIRNPFTKRKG